MGLFHWIIIFLGSLLASITTTNAQVDFLVTSDSTNPDNTAEHFVARIVDEDAIAIARAEIEKDESSGSWQIISGTIAKTKADWNPDWSFHLIPDTVFFGEFFMEVCDATVLFVEENLDIADGAFLPGLQWCPWGTRVLRELQTDDDVPADEDTPNDTTDPIAVPGPAPPAATPQSPPTTTTNATTNATDSTSNVTEPTAGNTTMETPLSFVDFLVTSDSNNIEDQTQHFVARITNATAIAQAREELQKTFNFSIIAGTIEKEPVGWNPGWSYHVIPNTVYFGDHSDDNDEFSLECDETAAFIQDNLDEAGFGFLPDLFWCPGETRVLAEISNTDDNDGATGGGGDTEISGAPSSAPAAATSPTSTVAPSSIAALPTSPEPTVPTTSRPTVFTPYVDFLLTADATNVSNTAEHFVARLVHNTSIAMARLELKKSGKNLRILSGIIEKFGVSWNYSPSNGYWSYHLVPSTIFFGEAFPQSCNASATQIEQNLNAAGSSSFLPNLQWCPHGTRVLAEIQAVFTPEGETIAPTAYPATDRPTVSAVPSMMPTAPTTAAPSSFSPFVDFLLTSDFTNPLNTAEHFVARLVNKTDIAVARVEVNKTRNFRIVSGTIGKEPVGWNPGWSYHLIPETIVFGDFFAEVCDASATYVEANLADAGGAFLPGLQWCPWGTRVLSELQAVDNNGTTAAPSESSAPTVLAMPAPSTMPTSPAPSTTLGSNAPAAPTTPVPTVPGTIRPTAFFPYVDFVVTSNNADPEDVSQHYVARIVHAASIAQAREELNKTENFMIISGIIEKTLVDWNPGWSYHLIPNTVFFGDVFTEVCDANAVYVEENLEAAGGSFLPRLQWCPWNTRVLKELPAPDGPTTPPQPAPPPSSSLTTAPGTGLGATLAPTESIPPTSRAVITCSFFSWSSAWFANVLVLVSSSFL